jgi:hypothetical protein
MYVRSPAHERDFILSQLTDGIVERFCGSGEIWENRMFTGGVTIPEQALIKFTCHLRAIIVIHGP